ncbi:hypothetical protein Pelo_15847 [Pelomyxa schiedti]|nr:hypothetical protein Pelo_15847 [Pelomyxa schiedti]
MRNTWEPLSFVITQNATPRNFWKSVRYRSPNRGTVELITASALREQVCTRSTKTSSKDLDVSENDSSTTSSLVLSKKCSHALSLLVSSNESTVGFLITVGPHEFFLGISTMIILLLFPSHNTTHFPLVLYEGTVL